MVFFETSCRKAECLPQEKLHLVHELQKEGHSVAVIGDGVNDAPALAAGDLGIAVLALSQLNRQPDLRPRNEIRLSDLRETDTIGHEADLVLFLHRPGLNGKEGKPDALQLTKNRLPGGQPVDWLELRYRGDMNSYEEA